ncbi:hypothetical protein [Motilibacter aurantiacus]|uniref:hypothetical protein n=1 Tax=Motilibacter aurantiacus TaxID=2714955 RepID=UPI00140A50D9|nr:hypothetical protein [Motilibacter aurantiacus]NHC46673.1 hypothetical protein [Motilibacter aurantiacus]
MAARAYQAHGYTLTSEVALTLPEAPVGWTGDPGRQLRVRLGEPRPVPATAPAGVPLTGPEGQGLPYAFVRAPDGGVVLRFFGVADLVADPGLTDVVAHLAPGTAEEVLPLLVTGLLVSTRLLLDGELLLHASAVARSGSAVAFVAASGAGKSTLATLLGREGWSLLTDDVLRVSLGGGAALGWPGSVETRLRPDALVLVDGPQSAHTTVDGRTAVRARRAEAGPLPVRVVAVPRRSAGLAGPRVLPLPPGEAIAVLLGLPRVVGWQDPASSRAQFELLADLVERVPVVVLETPEGPPFADRLAADVAALLDGVRAPSG